MLFMSGPEMEKKQQNLFNVLIDFFRLHGCTSLTAGLDSGNAFKALYHFGGDFRIKSNHYNKTFEVYLPFCLVAGR